MIRTTDAMIKAMNVQKLKERRASNLDALQKASEAGRKDMVALFKSWIEIDDRDIANAMTLLRNPAA